MSTVSILEIKAGLQVAKPQAEVFDAIINPEKMKNYFISESSGIMKEGATLTWKFPEFDMDIPIRVGKVEKDKYVSYYWNDMDGTETLVEMHLEEKEPGVTFVRITEKERTNDEAGINWLRRNTEGWANFLACMKAWLEYGINLRKKAFNSSQLPEIKK